MGTREILSRDFILTFIAKFVFSSVYYILITTLPIYLSRFKSTEVEIGVLIGTFSVSSLILRPFVGRALLKTPERNFMIAGSLLFVLTSFAYLFSPPFWPFFIVRIFQGIGWAFFYTASFTFIANISSEAHKGQALSYFYMAMNTAFALAPYFGMLLINRFNFTLLFLICSGLSICSLFTTTKLRKMQGVPLGSQPAEDQPLLSRKAFAPSLVGFFTNMIWGALITFFPLYAITQGVSNPGLFFATFAIMLILGRGLGGKILDVYNRKKVIFPCIIAHIIAMVVLSFSKNLSMFILVAIFWGLGSAFLFPALLVYTLELESSSRGPAMGTFTAIADLGTGLGAVVMGIILRFTNYPTMFLCLAFVGFINLNYFIFFVKNRKKGPF